MTDHPITFRVDGTPVPWAKAYNKPATEDSAARKIIPARSQEHAARIMVAWDALGDLEPVRKPAGVMLGAIFHICRPALHYGTGANEHVVKDRYLDAEPTGKPDLSNLVKLVEDALTTRAWDDDDQVVAFGEVRKCYVHKWDRPGSVITVDLAGWQPHGFSRDPDPQLTIVGDG